MRLPSKLFDNFIAEPKMPEIEFLFCFFCVFLQSFFSEEGARCIPSSCPRAYAVAGADTAPQAPRRGEEGRAAEEGGEVLWQPQDFRRCAVVATYMLPLL